jgi:hypothetical protein
MSKKEPIRIALTLEGDVAKRFEAVKKKWGLEANTDVIRMLITQYYDQIPIERPTLEHVNLNDLGVLVKDHSLEPPQGRLIQIYFREGKARCEYDETENCRHTDFALELPEVREIFRKKGWKTK